MAASGKLSLAYLRRALSVDCLQACMNSCVIPAPVATKMYLSCSRAYHDWKSELDTLTSNEFRDLVPAGEY